MMRLCEIRLKGEHALLPQYMICSLTIYMHTTVLLINYSSGFIGSGHCYYIYTSEVQTALKALAGNPLRNYYSYEESVQQLQNELAKEKQS